MEEKFPHLVIPSVSRNVEKRKIVIPWMPTLIKSERLYLGRHEQAEELTVLKGLSITHVLSIGRC